MNNKILLQKLFAGTPAERKAARGKINQPLIGCLLRNSLVLVGMNLVGYRQSPEKFKTMTKAEFEKQGGKIVFRWKEKENDT